MNKKQITAIGLAAMISSIAGISYLSQPCIAPKQIDYDVDAEQGYSFKIIAPDNRYCIITGAVMTKADYVRMQNNVGVFTVLEKTPVNAKPTYEYCEIAKWLYNAHTDTYPKIQQQFKDLLLPIDCRNTTIHLNDSLSILDESTTIVTIPEFSYSMLILTAGLLPLIIWRLRSKS